ncbi:hypothetical protein ADEAN_001003500 [Angomonas deanei]|uniref:Uncharacterized protein n=1 Tax=Angomonas deanei TaxID=59799 RepID=A0A7G2CTU6_9TRYP|nr:hypothetical protein ADEAN_001003500 [Angomonas deanei]
MGAVVYEVEPVDGRQLPLSFSPLSVIYQPHRTIQCVDTPTTADAPVVCGDKRNCVTVHRQESVANFFLPVDDWFSLRTAGPAGVLDVVVTDRREDYIMCRRADGQQPLWMISISSGACWPLCGEKSDEKLEKVRIFKPKVSASLYGLSLRHSELYLSQHGVASLDVRLATDGGGEVVGVETSDDEVCWCVLQRAANGEHTVALFDIRNPSTPLYRHTFDHAGEHISATSVENEGFVVLCGETFSSHSFRVNTSVNVAHYELPPPPDGLTADVLFHDRSLLYITT